MYLETREEKPRGLSWDLHGQERTAWVHAGPGRGVNSDIETNRPTWGRRKKREKKGKGLFLR